MRIGLVVSGGVDRSGRERVTPSLLWLIERLARRHDVRVFVLNYYPESCSYPLLGASVHDLGRVDAPLPFRRVTQRHRLSTALEANRRFDVLHTYQGMPAIVSAPVARRLGVPLVMTLDSGEMVSIDDIGYGLQRRWFDRRSLAAAARVAARVTVATTFMATMVRDVVGITPLALVPLGVDASRFSLSRRDEHPPWRLLRVASLNAVKDYPTLLRALSLLVRRGLDVHLDVAGEDTMNGAAQAMAGALGVDARVTFHGVLPTDRLAALYARAHLHVVSSRHEAAGVAILEASAAGVATVGTVVGYVADWHPSKALAVPVRDPSALADAIGDLLGDRRRREQLAAAAREWTLAHDADWTAGEFDRIYRQVCGQARRPSLGRHL
jgi:glycosyltransferase involved in cell wall biosynthesis